MDGFMRLPRARGGDRAEEAPCEPGGSNKRLGAIGGLAFLGLLLVPLLAPASEVDVRLAYARAAGGQWLVTTRVDFDLDAEAERLVRQGLRLKVEVEFSVAQPRPVLTPKRLDGFVRTLYLEYDAALGRFVVSTPSADVRAEFATMFSALRKIGYLTDQPVIAQSALAAGQPYAFSVQARVFPENANWWNRNVAGRLGLGLSLSSNPYTWSLTP